MNFETAKWKLGIVRTNLFEVLSHVNHEYATRFDCELRDIFLALEAQLAHRHIIGKSYEVSAQSINRLAGELEEARMKTNELGDEFSRLRRELVQSQDRIKVLEEENRSLRAEIDLRSIPLITHLRKRLDEIDQEKQASDQRPNIGEMLCPEARYCFLNIE